MKIRSITYFLNPGWPLDSIILQRAGEFIEVARPTFEEAGFEVQTVRLATPPFPNLLTDAQAASSLGLAKEMEAAAQAMRYDYVSLGPALPDIPKSYEHVCEMIASTETIFISGFMTSIEGEVSLKAVRACAEIIHGAAKLSEDGFANLRFAALANVPPGAPFFPAAYHRGDVPYFALAIEAADLAVKAFEDAKDLEEARQRLIASIEDNARLMETIAEMLSQRFEVQFSGIDFTLAPFPERSLSIGTAMELLGIPAVGGHGSLAAAAILADTLDQAKFRRAGFNGLMLPVLEDAVLAERAAEGTLGVKELLLYSTVCGTGLDTIPLPGDTSVEQIYAVLLDLAALSQRLNKPLTARLMPIPGKRAGDQTGFDFAYFSNSRVLPIEAEPLRKPLASQGNFRVCPR